MLNGMSLEELNALYDEKHDPISMDYDEFFGEMHLTSTQKQKRKKTAEKMQEIMEWLLAIVYYYMSGGVYDYMDAIAEAEQSYKDLVRDTGVSDSFVNNHISMTVTSVVSTMEKNPDNIYNFTNDRARMIAENEANSIWNDAEFEEALRSGKKYKTWHAIIDKRTRDTHKEVNGKTIPITEYFIVGNSLMLFPRDSNAEDEEVVNCRCSLSYR